MRLGCLFDHLLAGALCVGVTCFDAVDQNCQRYLIEVAGDFFKPIAPVVCPRWEEDGRGWGGPQSDLWGEATEDLSNTRLEYH